ncbi:MAG: AraC family transcriptional regulator [Clostridia bacterium]|nr:AraC family transcriptional regulator [Clostridia bacterium]
MKENKFGFFEPAYDDRAYNIYLTYATKLAEEAHFHSRFEFLYIADGEIEAVINGRTCLRTAGECVVVNPFEAHYYRQKSPSVHAYVLVVDDLYLSDFYRIYGKKRIVFDPRKGLGVFGEKIRFYLDKWIWDSDLEDVLSNQAWLDLILSELIKVYGLRDVEAGKLSNAEILKYIQDHYSEDLTMANVAEKMGYTKEYFSSVFNKLVGMNFRSYLNKLRLEKAKILLKDKNRRVTDVVAEVGFSNTVMYYRALKKFGKEKDDASV